MMPSITSCLAKTLLQRENVLCKSFNSKKAAESSIGKSKFGIWPILSACKCIHQLVLAKLLSIFQRSIYMYGTCNVGNVLWPGAPPWHNVGMIPRVRDNMVLAWFLFQSGTCKCPTHASWKKRLRAPMDVQWFATWNSWALNICAQERVWRTSFLRWSHVKQLYFLHKVYMCT